ncbi:MAG: GNAT family N-acetyltransferase [Bacteroidaceae bacterium]|nr:GNAT family N-acetyltransferase [Bacteroidaceae bacterium]
MLTLTPINTRSKHYPFVEQLLHEAFPESERRDDDRQRDLTENNLRFHCLLVQTELLQPVGLLTYWFFDDFVYIEHFAISEAERGKGYGSEAMKLFIEQIELPVILEAEMPHHSNDLPNRRIKFYKRLGFRVCSMQYKQPPYRCTDKWVPMKILKYGDMQITRLIKDILYRQVYGFIGW